MTLRFKMVKLTTIDIYTRFRSNRHDFLTTDQDHTRHRSIVLEPKHNYIII